MNRFLALTLLLALLPAMTFAQETRTIHRQAYDCFTNEECDETCQSACDKVCRKCHEESPAAMEQGISGQLWNPFKVQMDFAYPKFRPEAKEDDFWENLPQEHQACLGCHEDHVGEGQHPLGEVEVAEFFSSEKMGDEEKEEVRYFAGLLLCATCHDPHSREQSLLRVDNQGSSLCLFCHQK